VGKTAGEEPPCGVVASSMKQLIRSVIPKTSVRIRWLTELESCEVLVRGGGRLSNLLIAVTEMLSREGQRRASFELQTFVADKNQHGPWLSPFAMKLDLYDPQFSSQLARFSASSCKQVYAEISSTYAK